MPPASASSVRSADASMRSARSPALSLLDVCGFAIATLSQDLWRGTGIAWHASRVPIPKFAHPCGITWRRTSESKGHGQFYNSSAAFEPEVRNATCREVRRTSGSRHGPAQPGINHTRFTSINKRPAGPPASRVSHVPRHSAFLLAVPIGAALAGLCGASLWAQTAPKPPSGLRLTFDANTDEAAPRKKARRPAPPPGVIPKYGHEPGWGAGKTGFNSKNVPMRRKRPSDGTAGADTNGREPAANPAARPPGLALPPPPNTTRRGKPQAPAAAAPPRPPTPPGATPTP